MDSKTRRGDAKLRGPNVDTDNGGGFHWPVDLTRRGVGGLCPHPVCEPGVSLDFSPGASSCTGRALNAEVDGLHVLWCLFVSCEVCAESASV